MAASAEGVMAKVYTAVPGLSRQVGTYGVASNDTALTVPEDVAKELDANPEFRVEREDAPKVSTKKPEKGGGS